jgi:hypothetical protein
MSAMLEQLQWWAVALLAARKKRPYGFVRCAGDSPKIRGLPDMPQSVQA